MSAIDEFKIVFTGPMGAGKTTAIAAISEVPPVRTEVNNSDRMSHEKESTTVGFDLGRITLPNGRVVRLYGTPGQARYRFMWNILGAGAAGAIILLDASQPGAGVQLDQFVDTFAPLVPPGAIVVGVGRTEQPGATNSATFATRLANRGILVPVISVDVRQADDVRILVRALVCILEAQMKHGELA
ncbi:MAG TPA: GTP-binding protein [Chiayiivirga sp.]|nr:GTP-binding protein [Chiayiivirga sp.]